MTAPPRSPRKATAPPRTARGLGLALLGLAPIGFLVVFFAWPVLAIIGRGFAAGGLDVVLGDPRTWQLAGFTVASAAASTVVAMVAGLPVAFLLARVRLPGVGLARTLVLVPFVLPTVVVGLAFRALWPDGGVLPIVLANAFFNVAVVARTVAGLWARLDARTTDAARALGASPWRAFRSVTLPALAPAIASAAAVVFLFCATSFGVVLILGGARYRTLETEIYLRTVDLLDLSGAAALSLIQFTAVVAALVVGGLARRRRDGARIGSVRPRRPRGGEWWVVGAAGVVLALLVTPIVALLAESVSIEDGWSFAGYRALTSTGEKGALQVSGWDAAVNSLKVAIDATLLALVVGVLASVVLVALRRSPARAARGLGETMDAVLMLPLGVSAVTVGFGYLVTLDALPGDLRTSPYLVPLAQALVIIPLIVRMVLPVLRSVDVRLRQAASTLGASPLRVWREIDLPLTLRPLVAAAGFGFVVALGEFGATSFLARPTAPTLPVAVGTLMARPGELNNQMAYAACALLMLVTVLAVALIDRLGRGGVGEF
ncbi:ABC transporter permease [Amycolatopsis bullii]|uniref:ABC transporter permease n=1 Tax=Amycolatopsis bullii TaxID=941987 RepID=A0ABQ3KQ60_9PSEU|nr:ABC transporter permease [Amycolatopsis bullii]